MSEQRRIVKGNGSRRTPFVTNWYIVDEHGNTGMESLPRHHRRGHDTKGAAQAWLDMVDRRKAEAAAAVTTPDPAADERVMRRFAAVDALRVPADVSDDQARRLEADGKVRRETRKLYLPGKPVSEYQVIVEVQS